MHDPIAAGRRTALRAAAVQALTSGLVALGFLLLGPRAALAAGIGGLAVALGNALAAWMALGGIVPARVAFGRLLLGAMVKWGVVFVAFIAAFAIWRLPPLPLLAGLAIGLLAYLFALNAPSWGRSERRNRNRKG